MMNKEKIYFCFPVNGPNNGVKVISNYIFNHLSKKIKYDLISIDTAQAKGHSNFGSFSFDKIFNTFKLFLKLFKVNKKDYVYLNLTPKGFAFYRDLIMLFICKLKRANVTVHIHANELEKKLNQINRLILKKIKIIVINDDQFKKIKPLHEEVFLVRNALPDFVKNENVTKLENKTLQLLFFSNLSKQKGLYRLIELIKLINDNNISCELNICGGILEKNNEAIFEKLKLKYDFIHYYGPIVDEKEKFDFLMANDFLLFLSDKNYEVSPLVYIEALMSGLPIITTKQIVSDLIVNSGCAYHVNNEISEIIPILSKYNKNPLKINELKNKSRGYYLKEYSFKKFIDQIEKIIIK